MSSTEYDVIGVGLGPFNLGLAALLDPVPELRAAFFETEPEFSWHPGLLLPGTALQVPFLADLVTLADPTSRYSFLNYLHGRGRLYRFYFYEKFHISRREYDAYARWVAGQLASCRFGRRVDSVTPDQGGWLVRTGDAAYRTRAVVLGVGTSPAVPEFAQGVLGEDVFHSADYLRHRDKTIEASSVTVVGSGQSAAEIVVDLLEHALPAGTQVDWFTRGSGFLPMEYSKLGLEHFSPEYSAHFHRLPREVRDVVRSGQDLLYKGISADTSARIFDLLYDASVDGEDPPVAYAARCRLTAIEPSPTARRWRLTWHHIDEDATFIRDTDVVVLATGYEPSSLPVADGLLARDPDGRPEVDADYRLLLADGSPSTLFVQNAELHTHGVGAPDLGLGAHRNSVIVNALTGREEYAVNARTVFQRFGTAALSAPDPEETA